MMNRDAVVVRDQQRVVKARGVRATGAPRWLSALVAVVAIFSGSGAAATAAPGPRTTGYKLIAGYGPICTKPHHCGMQPIVHATAELLLHGKVVVRKLTNADGVALLIPTSTATTKSGYSLFVTGRVLGRTFVKRDRLPALMQGLVLPYDLSVSV